MPHLVNLASSLTELIADDNDSNVEAKKTAIISLQPLLSSKLKDGTDLGEAADDAVAIWSSGALQALGLPPLRGCERASGKGQNIVWMGEDLRKMKQAIVATGKPID